MARKLSRPPGRTRPPTTTGATRATTVPARRREDETAENFLIGLGLFLLAVIIFIPAFKAGFIWDDDQLLTANPQVHSFSGWWTLWLRPETADYFPLTSTTLWIEYHLGSFFSMWNVEFLQRYAAQDIWNGYHIMNVIYHAITVVLTWQVLKRLRIPGAGLIAAIFAVHPICVESVAWISERKNTISQIFLLLSVIQYLKFQQKENTRQYFLAVLCFGLSLLSKTAVVMLPFVLVLLAWWRRPDLEPLRENYEIEKSPLEKGVLLWTSVAGGAVMVTLAVLVGLTLSVAPPHSSLLVVLGKVQTGEIKVSGLVWNAALYMAALVGAGAGYFLGLQLQKIKQIGNFIGFQVVRVLPFLLLAFILGLVTFYFQNGRAIGGEEIPIGNFIQRMCSASFALGFYLYSAFWPFNIVEIYPQWHRAFAENVSLPVPHVQPPMPESIPYYLQAVPGVIIAALLVWCWLNRNKTWARAILVGLGSYILLILPALGMMKMSYMRLTLVADHFQYISIACVIALVVSAGVTRALKPAWLGVAALIFVFISWQNWKGTVDNHYFQILWILGVAALAAAAALKDMWRVAWLGFMCMLLTVFSVMSYAQSAIYHDEGTLWTATLDKNPTSWQAHNHIGAWLYMHQKWRDAYPHFKAATELKPENPESHNNLGLALSLYGRMDEAIKQFEIAVYIKEDSAMETNLANAYEQVGRFADAIRTYHRALALNPGNASAHCNLGYALMKENLIDQAIPEFMHTIELDPGMPQGHEDLMRALMQRGVNVNAPFDTRTYPFDVNRALQLLHSAQMPQQMAPGR
jgi:Tfp pilus assembly protein PilF